MRLPTLPVGMGPATGGGGMAGTFPPPGQGQGHVRSRVAPSTSYCISIDASMREKHIGTIPSALSLFYKKLEAKNQCDLI